jgi:hypothetical protein
MLTGLANGVFQTMTGGSMVFSSITGVSYDPLTGSIRPLRRKIFCYSGFKHSCSG